MPSFVSVMCFSGDPVNELALAYGMHALNHTGSSQEAILQYSLFVREYRQMMNEEYSTSYAELMSKNLLFIDKNISVNDIYSLIIRY